MDTKKGLRAVATETEIAWDHQVIVIMLNVVIVLVGMRVINHARPVRACDVIMIVNNNSTLIFHLLINENSRDFINRSHFPFGLMFIMWTSQDGNERRQC